MYMSCTGVHGTYSTCTSVHTCTTAQVRVPGYTGTTTVLVQTTAGSCMELETNDVTLNSQ